MEKNWNAINTHNKIINPLPKIKELCNQHYIIEDECEKYYSRLKSNDDRVRNNFEEWKEKITQIKMNDEKVAELTK